MRISLKLCYNLWILFFADWWSSAQSLLPTNCLSTVQLFIPSHVFGHLRVNLISFFSFVAPVPTFQRCFSAIKIKTSHSTTHPFFFLLFRVRVTVGLEPILATRGREVGYTLDRSPASHRDSRKTNTHQDFSLNCKMSQFKQLMCFLFLMWIKHGFMQFGNHCIFFLT